MDLYMVEYSAGTFFRSGRNNTVAVFDSLKSAKAQATIINSSKYRTAKIVKITGVEDVTNG